MKRWREGYQDGWRRARTLVLAVVALCGMLISSAWLSGTATAQIIEPSRPFSHIVGDWNATFDRVERYLQGTSFPNSSTRTNRAALTKVMDRARKAKTQASKKLSDIQGLLAALGPAPTEGQPGEAVTVGKQREQYNNDLVFYRTRVQQAELALARAAQLDSSLAELATQKLVGQLLSEQPTPFDGETYVAALSDALRMMQAIAVAPFDWWSALPDKQRASGKGVRLFLVLVFIVLVGWAFRRFLLKRFGKDVTLEAPSYTRRLFSAIAEGVARGIVPALFFAGILLRSVNEASNLDGLFAEVVFGVCAGMIVFITATAFVRAILSPRLPGWQLVPLYPANAVRISRNVTVLAAVSGIDLFFRLLFDDVAANQEFRTLYSAVFNTLEGVLLISLCRAARWERPVAEEEKATPSETPYTDRFWQSVRTVIVSFTVVSMAASWVGYGQLGDYLNENIGGSLIIAALLYLLRGLLRELVGAGMRSPLLRDRLAVSHASRNVAKFWLRVAVDGMFLVIGLVLIAPLWGVPHDELSRWAIAALTGFTVGSFRISVLDTAFALAIFIGLMLVTRMLQRVLSDRVLPQTQLEPGIQHSVAAGFGYVGIVIAAALGITALGVDLSNLAIIAGALSVGIGFGLQNIVNNFVSGLILLIERPIKVGDWVVVAGNEGLVRRISVRATEIQTFQRASVIVPNAEFLSNSLTNWTHKDRNGRIEIPIGVAYGSDVRQVEELLLSIANAHEEVLALPEPFVLFMNFGGSSLDFELRCYTENVTRRLRIASALRFEIDAAFREADIEIPFPQHVVHMVPPEEPKET
jgi:potassium-dependent mechanosensitive channel